MKQPLEWTRLKSILTKIIRSHPNTIVGAGDDAFVFAPFSDNQVWCQDLMVEGTHFKTEWSKPEDIGFKAMARNLSDFAAMGAIPQLAQVSLVLPQKYSDTWLDSFYTGLLEAADASQVEIVGGDLSTGPAIFIDVSVLGNTERPLTRARSQEGDLILASGPLGLGKTGLQVLQHKLSPTKFANSLKRQLRGQARLDLISQLQKNAPLIHACIDTSDDLASSLYQLLNQDQLGAKIEITDSWIHSEVKEISENLNQNIIDYLIYGGEDFELLITIAPEAKDFFPEWIEIGKIQNGPFEYVKDNTSHKIDFTKAWDPF
ncbi:MAG: thiamine-phosphate kinase [Bdellovibrionia bacterium]